jgi:outer membrane protein W
MKKYLVVAMVMAMATAVYAQPSIMEGTREFSISGGYDPDGVVGSELDLELGYGVFLRDGVEVGGLLGYTSYEDAGLGGDLKVWALGGFVEYHFDMASMSVPYIGATVGYSNYDTGALDDSSFVYGPRVGVKYFIADNVAVDIALEYLLASEDIFVNEGVVEDNDLSLSFGIRAMF